MTADFVASADNYRGTSNRGIASRGPLRATLSSVETIPVPEVVRKAMTPGRRLAIYSHHGLPTQTGEVRGFNHYSIYDENDRLVFEFTEKTVDHVEVPNSEAATPGPDASRLRAIEQAPRAAVKAKSPTTKKRGVHSRGTGRLSPRARRLAKLLKDNARRDDAEFKREQQREHRARERELERNEFIKYPIPLPVEMIQMRWKRVEQRIREHNEQKTAIKSMKKSGVGILERAGEKGEREQENYIRVHRDDYMRVIQLLNEPKFWSRFWTKVRRERHPDWSRSRYNFDHFMEWWAEGPEIFYFYVALRARVEHIDRYTEASQAYQQLPDDLKILWNREQFFRLR